MRTQTLAFAVAEMNAAHSAYRQSRIAVGELLFVEHPELAEVLKQIQVNPVEAIPWLCELHFDSGTKSAAELAAQGRIAEVIRRIHQQAAGVYL